MYLPTKFPDLYSNNKVNKRDVRPFPHQMDEWRESLKQNRESTVTDQTQPAEWPDYISNATLQL